MNKKGSAKWRKRAKKEIQKELSKEEYQIDLNIENVLALGKELMKTIEEFIDNNPDTINADIHYSLFQVAMFNYKGLKDLPDPPEVAYINEEEEGECLCDECKRKKELEKITKQHEAFASLYIL